MNLNRKYNNFLSFKFSSSTFYISGIIDLSKQHYFEIASFVHLVFPQVQGTAWFTVSKG